MGCGDDLKWPQPRGRQTKRGRPAKVKGTQAKKIKRETFMISLNRQPLVVVALAASVLSLMVGTAPLAHAGSETISYEFQFEGNPSTGYQWRLNASASKGLDIVDVESLGYGEPTSRLIGAPAPFRFRLTCTGSGTAELHFDYVSPDNTTIAQTHTHWARCE
jgi:inhibitor of cysteine peptidase